jgi:DNA-binding CsgD family transcriptional regulator
LIQETYALSRPRTPTRPDELTTKQRKLAALLARGFTLVEAAEKIGTPYKTADTHRGIIYGKLRIHSRPELTAWAILTGLVDARSVSRKRRKPSKKKPAKRRRRCPTCGRKM